MPGMPVKQPDSVSAAPVPLPPDGRPRAGHPPLVDRIRAGLQADGGWWPFDRFMAAALHEPGLGYYSRGSRQFGTLPADGSDFATAPEMSPLFGRALARQVGEGLQAAGSDEVWEFGAGSGALAEQLLGALGPRIGRYTIVDVSGALRARERLAAFGDRVAWAERLPPVMRGVVLGNEVLDAMPVRLLALGSGGWSERGVAWRGDGFVFEDRPTSARPPADAPFVPGTVTEIHDQAQAFVRTLAHRLERGLLLFVDYGFPEAEYYHPQRTGGTLMCHRAHRADADPLADVGDKDITAHVDFTGIALAAQDAGLDVLGYTSQARFLFNCGIASLLESATLAERIAAQRLLTEHEMGELFKVIAFGRGIVLDPLGFTEGDRLHRL
jgi:SAM-dependent MidA family methyltransferase